MAGKKTTAARKKPRAKRKPSRKKRFSWRPDISIKAVLYVLSLFLLLVATVGMLAYVIFFRVVVAAELGAAAPLFEEPLPGQIVIGGGDIDKGDAQPRLAILIDDMGHHPDIGRRLIELPFELSFSFLPHAPHTKELEKEAHLRGREILLHLPLEPKDSKWDPGPGALYLDDMPQQRQVFLDDLAMIPHAVGVNNHMGSRYTENRAAMESLLRLVEESKLFFIDSYTTPESLGYSLAGELGVPAARRQIFLDNVQEVEAICSQLEQLAEIARRQGAAIGIAHPHPQTLAALNACLPAALSGISLVGVEQLLN